MKCLKGSLIKPDLEILYKSISTKNNQQNLDLLTFYNAIYELSKKVYKNEKSMGLLLNELI